MIGTSVTNCFHTRPPTPSPPHLLLLSSLNCGIYDPDCSGAFSDSIHSWPKAHYCQDGSLDWRKKSIPAKQDKDNPKLIKSAFNFQCNLWLTIDPTIRMRNRYSCKIYLNLSFDVCLILAIDILKLLSNILKLGCLQDLLFFTQFTA